MTDRGGHFRLASVCSVIAVGGSGVARGVGGGTVLGRGLRLGLGLGLRLIKGDRAIVDDKRSIREGSRLWAGHASSSEQFAVERCLAGEDRVTQVDVRVLVACCDRPTNIVACPELVWMMHSHIVEARM